MKSEIYIGLEVHKNSAPLPFARPTCLAIDHPTVPPYDFPQQRFSLLFMANLARAEALKHRVAWTRRILVLVVALFSFSGVLYGDKAVSPEDLLARLTANANWTGNTQESWTASFRMTDEYSVSNSLMARLQSNADPAQRERLEGLLERIKMGQFPAERRAEREGLIAVSPDLIRVENRLISSAPQSTEMLVSFNLDFITKTNYSRLYSFSGGPADRAFPGEADMRLHGPTPLSLSPGLIKSQMPRFINSLTNITAAMKVGSTNSILIVQGQDSTRECSATCLIEIDLMRQWLPQRVLVQECDGGETEITIDSAKQTIGWVPVHAELSRKVASGEVVYKETWDFADYSIHRSLPARTHAFKVPVDYLVNEYRSSNAFAYVMGFRPPTRKELALMAKDKNAIIKYQRDSRRSFPQLRPFLLGLILTSLLLPLILLVKRGNAKTDASHTKTP